MKTASDFRQTALYGLTGRWKTAVLAGMIAALLSGASYDMLEIRINLEQVDPTLVPIVFGSALALLAKAILVGSVVAVGYARFNLDLIEKPEEPTVKSLFFFFRHWKTGVCAGLLQDLYVLLWSLLLIFPGIVASYSYAMTNYILAEHPKLTAGEAIARSKMLMEGNRWRLFCLNFSFIGWELLCVFSLGIGALWLMPYKHAAYAAFYREISGKA